MTVEETAEAIRNSNTKWDRRMMELPKIDGLIGPLDVSTEAWREYYWPDTGVTYRIIDPYALYRRDGGTTHRVVDRNGVVHCVPCGKEHPNTVIRWQNRDTSVPVNW